MLAPFLMVPHVGSPTIFFGTIFVVVEIGAFIPLLFGRETGGQLETVTEGVPAFLAAPAERPVSALLADPRGTDSNGQDAPKVVAHVAN